MSFTIHFPHWLLPFVIGCVVGAVGIVVLFVVSESAAMRGSGV